MDGIINRWGSIKRCCYTVLMRPEMLLDWKMTRNASPLLVNAKMILQVNLPEVGYDFIPLLIMNRFMHWGKLNLNTAKQD